MVSNDWHTFQIPIICPHCSGRLKHKIELSVQAGANTVDFDTIALYRSPIRHKLALAGGYESILKESFEISVKGVNLKESRTIKMIADEPTVFLEAERTLEKGTKGNTKIVSMLDFASYEQISFDGKKQFDCGANSKIPIYIQLADSQKLLPDLTIFLLEAKNVEQIEWENGVINLISRVKGKGTIKLAATLRKNDPETTLNYFQEFRRQQIVLNGKSANLSNDSSITQVKLVEIKDPKKGPYFVEEKGWWSVRGAQPLRESDKAWDNYLTAYDHWVVNKDKGPMPMPPYKSDLVQLIIPPNGQAELQSYGFIDGIVRPGWGSQKQLLIKAVEPDSSTVRVMSVTPYIFAPRIEFSDPFISAKLNGKPWAYHDSQHVFLPQKPGIYKVEVIRTGKPHPTVTTTAASVESAVFSGNELTAKISNPAYVFKLPEGLNYHLGISFDPTTYQVKSITGGKLVRQGPLGAIITCQENMIHIHFKEIAVP